MQTKILHWQTTSLAEHLAFGNFYDSIDPKIDRFIEAIQGKYGRIFFGGIEAVQLSDYSNLKMPIFVSEMENFFKTEIYSCGLNISNDSDIENISQEIRGEIDKLKFLLTLK